MMIMMKITEQLSRSQEKVKGKLLKYQSSLSLFELFLVLRRARHLLDDNDCCSQ